MWETIKGFVIPSALLISLVLGGVYLLVTSIMSYQFNLKVREACTSTQH